MRRISANSLFVLSIAMACAGCTSYASKPIINEHVESGRKQTVSSFTYEIASPWKDSRFGKRAYDATQKIIPDAKHISSTPTASAVPALAIKVSEFSSGGACAQEYLTGLSLGLIPSWCTRPELFKFNFILNNDHGVCRQKTYSISSLTVAHITLIPFALFDTDNQPLALYQAALNDFLQDTPCATP